MESGGVVVWVEEGDGGFVGISIISAFGDMLAREPWPWAYRKRAEIAMLGFWVQARRQYSHSVLSFV